MSVKTPPHRPDAPRFERALIPLTHLSAAAILVATLIRLLSTHSRFPWWELDPSRQPVPETTLLPSQALTLDTIVWLASMLGVGACVMLGRPLRWITGLLALIGCAGAMTTSIFMGARAGTGPDDAVLASAWSSAIIGAWAMSHLAADPAIRRHVFAVIAGAAWVLAAKGAYQVFIEHPATVAHYKANTEAMLAAQGIEPGSTGAREFERRLMQPEATGWVGMSNAHASILAAMLAMTLALAWSAWSDVRAKRLPSGSAGVLTLTAVAAAGGLAMTFSKGGIVAGLLAVTLSIWVARPRAACQSPADQRTAPLVVLAPALPLLALAAIALRGALGESLGERSLLFRSQYLQASLRIIADSFPLGVGPGGFKAAYALHKPALSPETVESPHSILFDWTACLGAFGVAWCVLLFTWLAIAASNSPTEKARATALSASQAKGIAFSRNGMSERDSDSVSSFQSSSAVWLLVPILSCAVAWTREAPTVAPDEWLVRAIGVLGWLATIHTAGSVSAHRLIAASLLAAAVALVTHAQIELTTVLPATAATVFLVIGLAAARSECLEPPSSGRRIRLALVCLASLAPMGASGWAARIKETWESHLRAAAEPAAELAELRVQLQMWRNGQSSADALIAALQRSLGRRPDSPDAASITRAYALAAEAAAERASDSLRRAAAARIMFSNHSRPFESEIRLRVGVALEAAALGETEVARRQASRADEVILAVETDRFGPVAGRRSGRGQGQFAASAGPAYQAMASIDPDPKWLELALARWRTVSELDPTALTPVLRQIDILTQLDRLEEARPLAARALELNANLRLDPLKQLGDAQRLKLESLATGPLDAKGGHTGEPNP